MLARFCLSIIIHLPVPTIKGVIKDEKISVSKLTWPKTEHIEDCSPLAT